MSVEDWDERAEIGPRTRWFWDPLRSEHVARYLWARSIIGHGLVLDVACGTGYGSALLAGPGRRVLGIDASATTIAHARRDFARADVTFMVGDATRLPVATSSIDSVVSFETIEHLPAPALFVAEIARVLRPKGTLLLSTPDRAVYSHGRTDGRSNNPFHPSEMTRLELLDLLRGQLKIRDILGQRATHGAATQVDARQERSLSLEMRRMAKQAIRAATTPVIGTDALARWLFPRVRRRYMPVSSASEEFVYIVVRAEKA
jgi:SAM-dependent methyltransferase